MISSQSRVAGLRPGVAVDATFSHAEISNGYELGRTVLCRLGPDMAVCIG